MTSPRNDLVARLIAPDLIGPMSPETASELVRLVEENSSRNALHHVIARAADTGSVSFADLGIILGSAVTAPYTPQPLPEPELLEPFTKDGEQ